MQDPKRRDIEIGTPCPKSWSSLVGDEKRRFCSECSLHVHNSAALTRDEALELVEGSNERVCMRIVRDANGAPQYLDSCTPAADVREAEGPIRALPRAAGWILVAGAGLLSACPESAPPIDPAPGGKPVIIDDPVMGIVAPVPPERMGKAAPTAVLGDAVQVELGEVTLPLEHQGSIESPDCGPIDEGDDADDAECQPGQEGAQVETLGRVAPLDEPPSPRD